MMLASGCAATSVYLFVLCLCLSYSKIPVDHAFLLKGSWRTKTARAPVKANEDKDAIVRQEQVWS